MKIKESIEIIKKYYDKDKPYICAFSGGKDSIVIYDLCHKTGLPIEYIYSNTTIDPPGHISFIRKNYPDVEIRQPKMSFYQLIAKRGLPTRQARFCCQELKEYYGGKSNIIVGLRISEGVKRGNRLKVLEHPYADDTRIKGKRHIYPIMHWTDDDVWDYIHERKLPYPEHYDRGFDRLGCVGCPLANKTQRIKEYKLYPRYVYATIKAIKKNIDAGGNLSKVFNDPYEAFYWWISEQSTLDHKSPRLFKINYEEEIKKLFPVIQHTKRFGKEK